MGGALTTGDGSDTSWGRGCNGSGSTAVAAATGASGGDGASCDNMLPITEDPPAGCSTAMDGRARGELLSAPMLNWDTRRRPSRGEGVLDPDGRVPGDAAATASSNRERALAAADAAADASAAARSSSNAPAFAAAVAAAATALAAAASSRSARASWVAACARDAAVDMEGDRTLGGPSATLVRRETAVTTDGLPLLRGSPPAGSEEPRRSTTCRGGRGATGRPCCHARATLRCTSAEL